MTHSPNPTYPLYQQLSEERYHSGQMHSGSYNRTLPSSSSADPWRPSSVDFPGGGRLQGPLPYPSHADLPMSPPSSDFRPPHSVHSPASSFIQYQPPASLAHTAEHSPSRGAVHTPTATHAHYQQPMEMCYAPYLDRPNPNSRNTTQLPYALVPTAPSPVPSDVPPETSESTIKKKRKRADHRQIEALNRMYARTKFPSTEERQQLARDLDMSARRVQNWFAHAFFWRHFCLNHFRFKNKRQAGRQRGRNPPANPSISQVAVSIPPDTPPVVMHICGSSPPVSPMGEASYRFRSPMGAPMRFGQTPSPPSGRTRADIDPRNVRYWGR